MCGIVGLSQKSDFFPRKNLEKAVAALSHRGPDNTGYYLQNNIALAHTRLSIIDLAGGDQPLVSDDGNFALIANGEIYNYIEVRKDLENQGYAFATRSDCETIIHGYRRYGNDFIHHLNGMFAFALYDKTRKTLFLARDRLGIKPLFYTALSDGFAFASEIKALLPFLKETPSVNPSALSRFFQCQFSSGRDTIIQGVHRVLPGEMIQIDGGLQMTRHRYWSPLSIKPQTIDFPQAAETFDALFEQVIMEHVRSDVPYGLFLSGGVDSAVILAMLAKFQGAPIRTYSVGYQIDGQSRSGNGRATDELQSAEWISRRFNTRHTTLRLDQKAVFNAVPFSVWAADDLMFDYAALPTALLSERAGRDLKVVFTGEGGDEAFAGYGRYKEPFIARWFKNLIHPGSGGFRVHGRIRDAYLRRIFNEKLKKERNRFRDPLIHAWNEAPAAWGNLEKRQYTDIATALPDNLLVKVDRMLMGFGLEGRVPFLDHRIIEFGLSLPARLKVSNGHGKYFLKKWAEKHLPPEHLWGKKRGFSVPIGQWLDPSFLCRLKDRLVLNRGVREWFDMDGVRSLIQQRIDAGDKQDKHASRAIWSLMQFAIWHRLFMEGDGRRPGISEDPLDYIA